LLVPGLNAAVAKDEIGCGAGGGLRPDLFTIRDGRCVMIATWYGGPGVSPPNDASLGGTPI
jgi:hypothetical protein